MSAGKVGSFIVQSLEGNTTQSGTSRTCANTRNMPEIKVVGAGAQTGEQNADNWPGVSASLRWLALSLAKQRACPEVAEQLHRESRFRTKLANFGASLASAGQAYAEFDQHWPLRAHVWSVPNLANIWPNLAKVCQNLAGADQTSPIAAKFGRVWLNIEQLWTIVSNWPESRLLGQFFSNCSATFGQRSGHFGARCDRPGFVSRARGEQPFRNFHNI